MRALGNHKIKLEIYLYECYFCNLNTFSFLNPGIPFRPIQDLF